LVIFYANKEAPFMSLFIYRHYEAQWMWETKQALHHLSEITGEITPDEMPSGMYITFCIGK